MNEFWDHHYQKFDIANASHFANCCLGRTLCSTDSVVELGCGNGRDAFTIAPHVKYYTGLDSSAVAIDLLQAKRDEADATLKSKMQFKQADFTDQLFDGFQKDADRLVIYSRFSYHSIGYEAAESLLVNIERISVPYVVLMEVRTVDDELYGEGEEIGLHEFMTDHYRRFIDPTAFLPILADRFRVSYFEINKGFAPFGEMDPAVLRTSFTSKSRS